MAAIDTATISCEGPDEDDAAPVLGLHVRNGQLGQDEAGAQVDGEGIVELVDGDIQDAGDAFPIAGIGHQDIRAVLSVLGLDLGKDTLDVLGGGDIGLVGGHFCRGPLG